jgi:hypothetical protein
MEDDINRIDAVRSLGFYNFHGPSDGDFVFPDGETPPTEEAIQAELARLQIEYDAQKYARNRALEYPPIADQQDMQFHDAIDGTTTWQDAIQAIKDKYPKPE